MAIVALCSRLFGLFLRRRSSVKQIIAARLPNLRSDRLSVVLCLGAIAIGIIALTGYVLGNASIASLGTNGKPVAAVAALVFIVLGAGLLALRSPTPNGLLTARRAAIAVIVIAAVDLLSAAFSAHIEEWQVWAIHGSAYFNPFPIAALLLLASGSALFFITTQRDLAGHVIASAVLLICVVFLFAYAVEVPSLLDPSRRVAPVAVATFGLMLISIAEVLARPRGWVIPLLSRTPVGVMARILLPMAIVVPVAALGLRDLMVDAHWFTPEVGSTLMVAADSLFAAAGVLATGVILLKRENDRMRLALIVDSSEDAILGASSHGLIESWNDGARRMFGYTAAEAIGRSVTMLAPPEVQDEVPLVFERVRRRERIDPFETVRVAKDGRRIDVWLSISPVLDDAGDVTGTSAIVHDITERKKAEKEIRRMAEQYAAVLATSSDGFWLTDLDGRLLEVNDTYCQMSGYSREELLKLGIGDLDAIETPEETASHIRSIVESGFARFETKQRTKDNRILDIEVSVSLWRAAGRMLSFERDITQRKQEQEALQRSKERLELAQRAAGIGHFSWDIQNNILTPSDELLALYGLRPGSFSGRYESWRALVFPDDLAVVDAEMKKSLASGEFSCDFRVVWPDASIHWLHSRAKVFFSDDGKPLRTVGVNMDITERMRTDGELRWKTALLEAQVDATIDGILVVDEEGKKIIQNSRCVDLLRIPKHAADNHDDKEQLELVTNRAKDPEQFIGRILYLYAHPNETSRDEVEFKDGTILDRYSAPVIGNDGTRFGRIWVFRDITEKKLADERFAKAMAELERSNHELARSEAALKEAQRIAHVGHWERSEVTGAVTWSDEVYRILGIPRGSVTPSYELFFGMVDPEDRRKLEDEVARALSSSGDGDIESDLRLTTPAGAVVTLSQHVFVDRDADGNVVGLHGTCQDITARVAGEQALRESEAALAEAQEIAHIGSWILYPESGELRGSVEMFRMFAVDPGPVALLPLFIDGIHEEDRAGVEAGFAAAVQTGTLDLEFRIVTPDGTRVARAIARKREVGESLLSLIGTTRDITEQKAAEEAIRQHSDGLERSNLELERFNRLAVGRELRMIELKQQINDLCAQLGQPAPYVLPEEPVLTVEKS